MELAIITPTYNRKKLLGRLYKSLLLQTDKKFRWVIIDDGSKDDTKEFIKELILKDNNFTIEYHIKENGGKARALNFAFKKIEDVDLFVIVDSDDFLLSNAVEQIREKYNDYKNDKRIGAFFFRYADSDGNVLRSQKSYSTECVLSRFEHDSRFKKDDGCIAYLKTAVKKYNYPEFENEKYMAPTLLQFRMAKDFKIVFTNDVIGIAEYQENGLTNSGRKIRLTSPLSMIAYCNYMQSKEFSIMIRLKYGIMANAYYYIGKSTIKNRRKLFYNIPLIGRLPGYILGVYWKRKYL